jgi:hypothetical protein
LQGSDDELIKLVETSRTLCPVHHASSPATYYNPVAKERWSPASLLLLGSNFDLSDFYLGTDLNPPQHIKIFTHQFSSHVLSRLNLLPFIQTNPSGKAYIVFRIDKTMYGLEEAGKLSNLRLVSLLSSFGFHETSTLSL